MSTTEETEETVKPKKSKLPLLIGLVLAVAGGGGGFFAVQSGMIGGGNAPSQAEAGDHGAETEGDASDAGLSLPDFAFVPLDPIVVSLPRSDRGSMLRFSAQLEVGPSYVEEVTNLKPRIVDVLNGYLRAVKLDDLTDPSALARLRSQMLRRVQIVAGEGKISDVLIMEFVVN